MNTVKHNLKVENAKAHKSALRAFHNDEEGMETIQVVMLVAIAALILIFVRSRWNDIKGWVGTLLQTITGWRSES